MKKKKLSIQLLVSCLLLIPPSTAWAELPESGDFYIGPTSNGWMNLSNSNDFETEFTDFMFTQCTIPAKISAKYVSTDYSDGGYSGVYGEYLNFENLKQLKLSTTGFSNSKITEIIFRYSYSGSAEYTLCISAGGTERSWTLDNQGGYQEIEEKGLNLQGPELTMTVSCNELSDECSIGISDIYITFEKGEEVLLEPGLFLPEAADLPLSWGKTVTVEGQCVGEGLTDEHVTIDVTPAFTPEEKPSDFTGTDKDAYFEAERCSGHVNADRNLELTLPCSGAYNVTISTKEGKGYKPASVSKMLYIAPDMSTLALNGIQPQGDILKVEESDRGDQWKSTKVTTDFIGGKIYYKITDTTQMKVVRRAPETQPEEGFSLYDDATGIDMSKGNELQLYAEKNGARTPVRTISYSPDNIMTGVEAVTADTPGQVEYYTIDGRRACEPLTPGLYLRRTPAGTTKILVR